MEKQKDLEEETKEEKEDRIEKQARQKFLKIFKKEFSDQLKNFRTKTSNTSLSYPKTLVGLLKNLDKNLANPDPVILIAIKDIMVDAIENKTRTPAIIKSLKNAGIENLWK
jgi:hypothetical protein